MRDRAPAKATHLQHATEVALNNPNLKKMNIKYPTLSANGLRFEFEFTQKSETDRRSEKLVRKFDFPASSKSGENSPAVVVEELMILGR